jgi:hypothetical protein
MTDFLNIAFIFFALTGVLCWVCMILLTVFYWLCSPERSKE